MSGYGLSDFDVDALLDTSLTFCIRRQSGMVYIGSGSRAAMQHCRCYLVEVLATGRCCSLAHPQRYLSCNMSKCTATVALRQVNCND